MECLNNPQLVQEGRRDDRTGVADNHLTVTKRIHEALKRLVDFETGSLDQVSKASLGRGVPLRINLRGLRNWGHRLGDDSAQWNGFFELRQTPTTVDVLNVVFRTSQAQLLDHLGCRECGVHQALFNDVQLEFCRQLLTLLRGLDEIHQAPNAKGEIALFERVVAVGMNAKLSQQRSQLALLGAGGQSLEEFYPLLHGIVAKIEEMRFADCLVSARWLLLEALNRV